MARSPRLDIPSCQSPRTTSCDEEKATEITSELRTFRIANKENHFADGRAAIFRRPLAATSHVIAIYSQVTKPPMPRTMVGPS
jgi:hypothetical protein